MSDLTTDAAERGEAPAAAAGSHPSELDAAAAAPGPAPGRTGLLRGATLFATGVCVGVAAHAVLFQAGLSPGAAPDVASGTGANIAGEARPHATEAPAVSLSALRAGTDEIPATATSNVDVTTLAALDPDAPAPEMTPEVTAEPEVTTASRVNRPTDPTLKGLTALDPDAPVRIELPASTTATAGTITATGTTTGTTTGTIAATEPQATTRGAILLAPKVEMVAVKPGDTMIALLTDAGATVMEAHDAVEALRPYYNLRQLRVGQEIALDFAPQPDEEAPGEMRLALAGLSLQADVDRDVKVRLDADGGFVGEEVVRELDVTQEIARGVIESSLYLTAQSQDMPAASIVDFIRIFSYGVDFQREVREGDAFEALYETYLDEAGERVKTGNLLFGALTLGGKEKRLYRFEEPDTGVVDWYDEKGASMKRFLMRTPVDGARLTSKFGMRRHPILGYSKMHKGIDFAAPRGTPVMAAGDGVIDFAGRRGGYGNYIRIRHNGTYSTAYAHLHKFRKGMKKGTRVSQGQIIGYVGSTGRSTGPHLHYEILSKGKQMNPLDVRLPVGRELEGKALKAFKRERDRIDALRDRLGSDTLVAGVKSGERAKKN